MRLNIRTRKILNYPIIDPNSKFMDWATLFVIATMIFLLLIESKPANAIPRSSLVSQHLDELTKKYPKSDAKTCEHSRPIPKFKFTPSIQDHHGHNLSPLSVCRQFVEEIHDWHQAWTRLNSQLADSNVRIDNQIDDAEIMELQKSLTATTLVASELEKNKLHDLVAGYVNIKSRAKQALQMSEALSRWQERIDAFRKRNSHRINEIDQLERKFFPESLLTFKQRLNLAQTELDEIVEDVKPLLANAKQEAYQLRNSSTELADISFRVRNQTISMDSLFSDENSELPPGPSNIIATDGVEFPPSAASPDSDLILKELFSESTQIEIADAISTDAELAAGVSNLLNGDYDSMPDLSTDQDNGNEQMEISKEESTPFQKVKAGVAKMSGGQKALLAGAVIVTGAAGLYAVKKYQQGMNANGLGEPGIGPDPIIGSSSSSSDANGFNIASRCILDPNISLTHQTCFELACRSGKCQQLTCKHNLSKELVAESANTKPILKPNPGPDSPYFSDFNNPGFECGLPKEISVKDAIEICQENGFGIEVLMTVNKSPCENFVYGDGRDIMQAANNQSN